MQIKILITSVSAERLWPLDKPYPPKLQISTNLNIVNLKAISETIVEAEFIYTANYSPPIAQITMKGTIKMAGSKDEITKLVEKHQKKQMPPTFIQPLINTVITEAVILAKTIGAPPPIPLPTIPTKPIKQGKTLTYHT